MNGVMAVAAADQTMADVSNESQLTTGLWLFTLMECAFPLTESWTKQLKIDEEQYFHDSLSVVVDPSKSAASAADYMTYSKDSTQMGTETGMLNTMVSKGKSQTQAEGQAMEQIYSMMEPLSQLVKSLTQAIMLAAT